MLTEPRLQYWVKSLGSESLELWRESMAQLRQLHNDVWNGVRFFTTINGILLAAIGASLASHRDPLFLSALAAVVSILGLAVTVVARRILYKHRRHYLEMWLRKSLIEDELGFYSRRIGKSNLSFPWSVSSDRLSELRLDPDAWIREQQDHPKSITHQLFRVYNWTMVTWVCVLLGSIMAVCWFLTGPANSVSGLLRQVIF